MALAKSIGNKKWGVGRMLLFALPFFGIGVGTTLWCAWIGLQHSEMRSWVETPAVIKHTELKAKQGGEGTTYETVAVYDYQFGGRAYTGEAVCIGGSDDVDHFQQDVYRELKQHVDQMQPFRCFVNPERPSEAVLYRDLRGAMMSFYTLFATVFGSVGLGLATAAIVSARRAPESKDNVPADAQWMSPSDREASLTPAKSNTQVAITTLSVVAVYWMFAISPLLWKFPDVLADSRGFWKWAPFAFPSIALLLIAGIAYLKIRQSKFDQPTLSLANSPANW